jgi:threo-3-hydroxy-L-aspartate ammonia-lyase
MAGLNRVDIPSFADVAAAAQRLDGVASRTPVLRSRTVDSLTRARVFFKCENFQRIGAFKFRGAYNALSQLSSQQRQRGVITFSSGNHAQAVALAGQLLAIPSTIVMPRDAPAIKLAATQSYGAEIVLYDRGGAHRETIAANLARERDLTIIPPFDHPHVIAGQGTAAQELIEDVGELDYLLVPVGGGGLISGCAIAAAALSPGCKVIGVEPELGDDAVRSFRDKALRSAPRADETIADGARTASLGAITFAAILRYCHDVVAVSDAALLQAMRVLFERMKIVVEPTGALAAAALLDGTVALDGARVGAIISGGNVSAQQFSQLLNFGH